MSVFSAAVHRVFLGLGSRARQAVSCLAGLLLLSGAVAAAEPALSDSAANQIKALLAEKESRTPVQRKIDSQLLYAARMAGGQPAANGVSSLTTDVQVEGPSHQVEVEIRAPVSAQVKGLIKAVGGRVVGAVPSLHAIHAWVPIARLEEVAADSTVRFIMQSTRPMLNGAVSLQGASTRGSVRLQRFRQTLEQALAANSAKVGNRISQGVATHGIGEVRSTYGLDGRGIRIGVLSDSFDAFGEAAADVLSGDLPGPGNPNGYLTPVRLAGSGDYFGLNATDEGRAMVQIVHDLAPGAELYFATANNIPADFANNIRALRGIATSPGAFGNVSPGCDIIIDDVFYYAESGLHDGQPASSSHNVAVVSQAVNDVTADGALYFSSAGNSGNLTQNTAGAWEGDYVAGPLPTAVAGSGDALVWSGTSVTNTVTAASSGGITMHWADPIGGSSNDYDLFVLNAAQTAVVASSTNIQNGTQDPYERASVGNSGIAANNRVVVVRRVGAAARFISLSSNRGRLQFATNGQIRGHSGAAQAFSVAATPTGEAFALGAAPGPYPGAFVGTNVTETFSSDGPRRLFFAADGSALTPGNFLAGTGGGLVRQKPDLTAADGVDTTLPPSSGLNPFYGTSAAAPHAGAIAALIKQAAPTATNSQIRAYLTSNALDIMASGTDNVTGVGVIQGLQSIQATGTTATPRAEFAIEGVEVVNGNQRLDPNDCNIVLVQVVNNGGANATGVSATLSSTTPGVTVTQGSSAYADMSAMGGRATNTIPFQVSTSSTVLDGSTVTFSLVLNLAGGAGTRTLTFDLPVGVDLANYAFTASASPTIATGGTLVTGSQADDAVVTVNTPFAFSVYGTAITEGQTITVSTNGNIQFVATGGSEAWGNLSLPAGIAAAPPLPNAPAVFPYWDDLELTTGGIFTQTLGTAPNRQFVVEWRGRLIPDTAGAFTVHFAVVFNEGSDQFQYLYERTGTGTGLNGASATIGVQAANSGSLFSEYDLPVLPLTQLAAAFPTSTPGTGTCNSSCPPILVAPASMPAGVAGTAYANQTLSATGGTAPYAFSVVGDLPTGLTLATDTLSGTPTRSGNFAFNVVAMDNNGCMGLGSYQVSVTCPTISLEPVATTLADGALDATYSQTFSVTGSPVGSVAFSTNASALPPGLSLSSGGALTGTANTAGRYTFPVTATDDATMCAYTRNYTATIDTATPYPGSCASPLFENAGLVSRTSGGGSGGTSPISISLVGTAATGYDANANGTTAVTTVADDFRVATGNVWVPSQLTFYAYQPAATSTASTISRINLRLWDGVPGAGGNIIATQNGITGTSSPAWVSNTFSGVYRVAPTALTATTRPLAAVTVPWPPVTSGWPASLPAGTYWVEWSMQGSVTAQGVFVPPSVVLNGTENSRQSSSARTTSPWVPVIGNDGLPVDFPFVVCGASLVDALFRDGFEN